MGSRRDSYLTRDSIGPGARPEGPSFGDVLAQRPEPVRGRKLVKPKAQPPEDTRKARKP